MNVGIAYALQGRQIWLKLEVPDGSTVVQAIEHSGILKRCPEIDLKRQKVGVFGKVVKLETPLEEGQRVEIYHPLIADPKTVQRRQRDDDDEDD